MYINTMIYLDHNPTTPLHPEVLKAITPFFQEDFGVASYSLLANLDLAGIAVSAGSACSSGSQHVSPVLEAMNLSSERTDSAVRFSLGNENTLADIDRVLQILPQIVQRLRQ